MGAPPALYRRAQTRCFRPSMRGREIDISGAAASTTAVVICEATENHDRGNLMWKTPPSTTLAACGASRLTILQIRVFRVEA